MIWNNVIGFSNCENWENNRVDFFFVIFNYIFYELLLELLNIN